MEAEAPKEGLRRGSGEGLRAPSARLPKPTPTAPRVQRSSAHPRGRARKTAPARGSAAPRKSPDKGKPRPPPAGPAPYRPHFVPIGRTPSTPKGEQAQNGHPRLSLASRFWQGGLLGAPSAGRVAPAGWAASIALGSNSAAKAILSLSNVTFSAPCRSQTTPA